MIRLASMPMPHVITMAHTVLDMFRVNSTSESMQCAVPAPDEIHRQGGVLKTEGSFISPDDWDELFVAIHTRLENCVGDTLNQSPELPLQDQKSKVKKAVLECVDALRHLHDSLMFERQSQQSR